MKTLSLLLFLAGCTMVQADDDGLLQNGDFSHGLSHCLETSRPPTDVPEAGSEAGAVIKLRSSDWTKATQDFEVKAGTYKLHVAFTITPDTHFSTQLTDYINVPAKAEFPDEHPLITHVGQWILAVMDPTAATSICWTVDPTQKSGPQSYTFTISGIDFTHRQTLVLAFPPGSGFITLNQVSLVPAGTPQQN